MLGNFVDVDLVDELVTVGAVEDVEDVEDVTASLSSELGDAEAASVSMGEKGQESSSSSKLVVVGKGENLVAVLRGLRVLALVDVGTPCVC